MSVTEDQPDAQQQPQPGQERDEVERAEPEALLVFDLGDQVGGGDIDEVPRGKRQQESGVEGEGSGGRDENAGGEWARGQGREGPENLFEVCFRKQQRHAAHERDDPHENAGGHDPKERRHQSTVPASNIPWVRAALTWSRTGTPSVPACCGGKRRSSSSGGETTTEEDCL